MPPVLTITAANFPLVSTTPVANNGINIRLQIPQSELEGKNLYIHMLTLLSQGVPTKLLKFFRLKIFSFAIGVNDTGGKWKKSSI